MIAVTFLGARILYKAFLLYGTADTSTFLDIWRGVFLLWNNHYHNNGCTCPSRPCTYNILVLWYFYLILRIQIVFMDQPLLLKLNLFSCTDNRKRGEDRWITDMVRCNFGDLLLACCNFACWDDSKSSKLCDLSSFLHVNDTEMHLPVCHICSLLYNTSKNHKRNDKLTLNLT